jgi:hypothetical protein
MFAAKSIESSIFTEQGQAILNQVGQICLLGSANKSRISLRALHRLHQATQRLLNTYDKEFQEKIQEYFRAKKIDIKQQKRIKQKIREHRKELVKGCFTKLNSLEENATEAITICSLKSLMYPDFLQIIRFVYPAPDIFNWKEVQLDIMAAVLAMYFYDYDYKAKQLKTSDKTPKKSKPAQSIFFSLPEGGEIVGNRLVEFCFNAGEEIRDEKLKEVFFEKTLADVMGCPVLYGTGNCALMTDCAFLTALSLGIEAPLTYIRFVSESNKKIDVVNAIALGPWPEPGCLVISPWQKEGICYPWQGEISETPEIMSLSKEYDNVKIILQIDPASPQGKRWKTALDKQQDFNNWHTLESRQKNLKILENNYSNLLQEMMRQEIITPETAETLLQRFHPENKAECKNESGEKEEPVLQKPSL